MDDDGYPDVVGFVINIGDDESHEKVRDDEEWVAGKDVHESEEDTTDEDAKEWFIR